MPRIAVGYDNWDLCEDAACRDRERAPEHIVVWLLNSLQYGWRGSSVAYFLRGLAYGYQPGSTCRLDDHQVIEEVRRALASGQIHICREQSLRKSAGGSAAPPPAKTQDEPPAIKPKKLTKTWVEFKVIDMEGNPAVGCKYLVVLPDGTRQDGTLGKTGIVRFENIDPENSVFTLPALDRDAWERI